MKPLRVREKKIMEQKGGCSCIKNKICPGPVAWLIGALPSAPKMLWVQFPVRTDT